jgi:hypothetical protein
MFEHSTPVTLKPALLMHHTTSPQSGYALLLKMQLSVARALNSYFDGRE